MSLPIFNGYPSEFLDFLGNLPATGDFDNELPITLPMNTRRMFATDDKDITGLIRKLSGTLHNRDLGTEASWCTTLSQKSNGDVLPSGDFSACSGSLPHVLQALNSTRTESTTYFIKVSGPFTLTRLHTLVSLPPFLTRPDAYYRVVVVHSTPSALSSHEGAAVES